MNGDNDSLIAHARAEHGNEGVREIYQRRVDVDRLLPA